MEAKHGITVEIGGYQVTIEKVGKVWRAVVNGQTICACMTRKACRQNAEFLLRSSMAAALTLRHVAPLQYPQAAPVQRA